MAPWISFCLSYFAVDSLRLLDQIQQSPLTTKKIGEEDCNKITDTNNIRTAEYKLELHMNKINYLFSKQMRIACLFILTAAAQLNAILVDPPDLDPSEVFSPDNPMPLKGEIINGRYYSQNNFFSCEAVDFGQEKYISQDSTDDDFACVAFYDKDANFRQAEVIALSGADKKKYDKGRLRDFFNRLGIGILEKVDYAKGIEILKEEMIGEDMLFVAVSVKKTAVLRSENGEFLSATRGYLVLLENEKMALLCSQRVTPPGGVHTPRKHIEKLKSEVLSFRRSFDFNLSQPTKMQGTKQ